MNEILSQEEIDALLRNDANFVEKSKKPEMNLSPEEIDALGEIGNISMGTAATTLFTLLNNKVTITTPEVTVTTIKEMASQYPIPYVAVEIQYTEGFEGRNLLIINKNDVKIITDLLMGGDGTKTEEELSDLHLSAIGEVMNQMMGSSCTSLASMFKKNINISPPKAFTIDFTSENTYNLFDSEEPIIKINFKMKVGNLINSYIMQLIPIDFAKSMVESLLNSQNLMENANTEDQQQVKENYIQDDSQKSYQDINNIAIDKPNKQMIQDKVKHVDVKPVSFQPLEEIKQDTNKKNIDLILDVPLQISVELGRTKKVIKDILEFNSGSIIELDKTAGEPVDILVNGKPIAKGEVVVIDDNFGVRITDIISPVKRLSNIK